MMPDVELEVCAELDLSFDEPAPTDIQGIPWDRLPRDRASYRKDRVQQYQNYLNASKALFNKHGNLPDFLKQEIPECLELPNERQLFPFHRNLTFLHTSIVHFQLRNLLWATSAHDVFAVHRHCVKRYNTVTEAATTVMDLSGQGRGAFNLGEVLVSTMCAERGLVAAGGFTGEIAIGAEGGDHRWAFRVSNDENCITNHLHICEASSGAAHVLASNNDLRLRQLDPTAAQIVQEMHLPWASNCAVQNPCNRKQLALVSDDKAVHFYDLASGKHTDSLHGHLDWGFAAAWHPAGNLLATGNQDCTTRLWDTRQTRESIAVLPASVGAIRSCRFSADGKYLAVAEPIDFVHIYDVESGLCAHQTIDFFGEVSGISFTPGGEMLMVGVPDQDYTSTLCFLREDMHDKRCQDA